MVVVVDVLAVVADVVVALLVDVTEVYAVEAAVVVATVVVAPDLGG